MYTFKSGDKGFKVTQYNTHDIRTGEPILKKSPSYAIFVRKVDANGKIKFGYGVTHDAKNKLLFRITDAPPHPKARPANATKKQKQEFYYSGDRYQEFFNDVKEVESTLNK